MNSKFDGHYLILGAAKQGLALADFILSQGGMVTITDLRNRAELGVEINSRQGKNITWYLESHPIDLLENIDFICPSGGVPLTLPILVEAKNHGIPFTNDSEIFTANASCLTVGITGTAGKTTTTTLLGRISEIASKEDQFDNSYVGGNIGYPLIEELGKITDKDIAIIEYSSFQLEIMQSSPNIATILNISANHLDRHASIENYIDAKCNIAKYQSEYDFYVYGRDDEKTRKLIGTSPAPHFSFGFSPLAENKFGTYVNNQSIWMKTQLFDREILKISEIALMGDHNVLNVMAAITLAILAGISDDAIREGIREFKGVEHRLEYVETWNGAKWYNDSKSTGPQMIIQALKSFKSPTILLAGGRDKDLPWEEFASQTAHQGHQFILFGEAASKINDALKNENNKLQPAIFTSLEKAIKKAKEIAKSGDIVLLSPGGTSFDEFANYEERGNFFKSKVLAFKYEKEQI